MEPVRNFEECLDLKLSGLRHDLLSCYYQSVSMQRTNCHDVCRDSLNDVSAQPMTPRADFSADPFFPYLQYVATPRSASGATSDGNDKRLVFQAAACPMGEIDALPWRFDEMLTDHVYQSELKDAPILEMWKLLTQGMLDRSRHDQNASWKKRVEVHPVWTIGQTISWELVLSRLDGSSAHRTITTSITTTTATTPVESNIRSLYVLHPSRRLPKLFLLLAAVVLAFEIVIFPVDLWFKVSLFKSMQIAFAVFWTCDSILTFMTGYYQNGSVVMHPAKVARHYIRTFFFLDVLIITSDWIALALDDSEDQQNGIIRAGRTFKAYRFMRVIRLFRVMKFVQYAQSYIDAFVTDMLGVVGRLVSLIMGVLFAGHYLACFWYALAQDSSQEVTWAHAAGLEDADDVYLYIVSLHWSLTQLTPATNNIAPANINERGFAVGVVICALIMFSTFLSSLTSAWSKVQRIYYKQWKEKAQIRQFVEARGVPLDCARQIWQFYRNHYKTSSKRMHLDDLDIFHKMPKALRTAIHEHVSIPTLCTNDVFARLSKVDRGTLLLVCDSAISELALGRDSELFSSGNEARCMYFIISGSVSYDCKLYRHMVLTSSPQSISEPAMWAHSWFHRGTLTATDPSEFLVVGANEFQMTLTRKVKFDVLACLSKYAERYIQEVNGGLNGARAITDIVHPRWRTEMQKHLNSIVEVAFSDVTGGYSSEGEDLIVKSSSFMSIAQRGMNVFRRY